MIVTNADVELPMFAGYTPEGAPILNDEVIFSEIYGAIFPPDMQAIAAGYEDVWNL